MQSHLIKLIIEQDAGRGVLDRFLIKIIEEIDEKVENNHITHNS